MDGLYQFVGSFVSEVVIYNKKRVDGTGDPEAECKKYIKDKLYRLAAEENGDGGQNDRKKVSHNYNLPTLRSDMDLGF